MSTTEIPTAANTDLKITDVIAHPVSVDLTNAKTSWGSYSRVSIVLVEIHTDAGISGVGECLARFAPEAYAEAIHTLHKPRLLGQNPLDIGLHAKNLRRALSGRAGGMAQEAMAGIDIALWDILGKVAGLPIYRLLGGIGRQMVPAYASSVGWHAEDGLAEASLRGDLSPKFPPILRRVLGLMFGLMRPAFPVPVWWRTRWA